MSVCSEFPQLCFCQILYELVYSWENYHKNNKGELFIETRCTYSAPCSCSPVRYWYYEICITKIMQIKSQVFEVHQESCLAHHTVSSTTPALWRASAVITDNIQASDLLNVSTFTLLTQEEVLLQPLTCYCYAYLKSNIPMTSCLQRGHVRCWISQRSTHRLWNSWAHGNMRILYTCTRDTQTVHIVNSSQSFC